MDAKLSWRRADCRWALRVDGEDIEWLVVTPEQAAEVARSDGVEFVSLDNLKRPEACVFAEAFFKVGIKTTVDVTWLEDDDGR